MTDFLPVFVISLKDASKRRESIAAHLNSLSIPFEFFDAVDGRSFDVASHPAYDRKRRYFYGRDLTGGELGCLLSHRGVMEEIVKRHLPHAIILEDDVLLSENFKQVVTSLMQASYPWEAVRFLGKSKITSLKKRDLEDLGTGYTLSRLATTPGGTYAYILTLSAAKVLLKHTSRNMVPIDTLIGWSWIHGLANLTIQPGIAMQNPDIHSIIGEQRFDKTLQITGFAKTLYPLTRLGLKIYEGLGKNLSYLGSATKDKAITSGRKTQQQ